MDQRTEPIKQDIDNIRDQMTEKIAAIEDKVKGQVTDTVEAVKQTFDVKQQVGDHPWAALGVAVLAGYVIGTLGDDDDSSTQYRADYSRHDQPRYQYSGSESNKGQTSYTSGGYNSSAYSSSNAGSGYVSSPSQSSPASSSSQSYNNFYSQPQSKSGGFLGDLMGQFGGELDTIKTAAISSLVAMVRDSIKDVLPQFSQEYDRVRQQHDDTPGRDSDATLNTLLRQPVSDPSANTTSGSRDFSNTGSYSSSGYGSSTNPSSETDSTMGSAVGAQDRDLSERSVSSRSFGATETTT